MNDSLGVFSYITEDITAIDLQDAITSTVDDEYIGYFEHVGNMTDSLTDRGADAAIAAGTEALASGTTNDIFQDAYDDNDPEIMTAFELIPPVTSFVSAWDVGNAIGEKLETLRADGIINDNLAAYAIYSAAAYLDDDTIITPKALAHAVQVAQLDPDTTTVKNVCDALQGAS